jgi:Fe-S cluster assembly protein SufD
MDRTNVADPVAHYAAEFEGAAAGLPGPARLRREAIDRFASLGFPDGSDEAWRFTDVSPIAEVPFRPPSGTANPSQWSMLARGPLKACQLAFVDCRPAPGFSSLDLPHGVTVKSLAAALREEPALVEPHLAPDGGTSFAALNAACFPDGAFVRLAPGAAVESPLHLLFLSSCHGEPYVTHPRVLVVAEAGARATVVESWLGPAGGVYFTNAVTGVVLGEGASLDYYKVQRESPLAFHVAALQARLGRHATFTHHSISLGGRLVRNDFAALLDGEGSDCTLNGLFEVAGTQHVDHHTSIDHATPHGTSRELYKGILDGRARGVFDGRIVVRPGAQKTSAMQTNKNLLLSKDALVHTKPQLEIFANDVKCKHGATIGQLDEGVLFYLRSRGIGLAEARRLLVHAFASEIIDEVRLDAVRAQLGGCLSLMIGAGR